MTDYTELVKSLRCNGTSMNGSCVGKKCGYYADGFCESMRMHNDAAAAIEDLIGTVGDLQAIRERLEELEEKQTIIDHYGQKWMTSAKDVPEAAYQHGFIDGQAEAQIPKHGEWIIEKASWGSPKYRCPYCHHDFYSNNGYTPKFCVECGAKMGVQE